MKVQTVTFIASSFSGLVLIICLIVICNIHLDVQNIWNQLENEMIDFKV